MNAALKFRSSYCRVSAKTVRKHHPTYRWDHHDLAFENRSLPERRCRPGAQRMPVRRCSIGSHRGNADCPDDRRCTQRPGSSSGAATSQGPSSNGNACSILTRQELTPLLRADPGPGKDNSDGTTTACVYTGAGAVSIVVDHSASSTDSKTQFGMYCSAQQPAGSESPPQPGLEKVSGIALADGACLSIVGGAVAAMYVLKGPEILSINIQTGLDAKITSDGLIALGKVAAGRL